MEHLKSIEWRRTILGMAAIFLAIAMPLSAVAHKPGKDARLPKIGQAPEFTLTAQNGVRSSLRAHLGNVVVVTFIFTSCTDTCPALTAKLSSIQKRLPPEVKNKVFFTAITVDPQRDTPEVLARYAEAHGVDPNHWAFLTGTTQEIGEVTRRYGIYAKKQEKGDVDHTFLTSFIDRNGTLRVQYLGVRFSPKEFTEDIISLVREAGSR